MCLENRQGRVIERSNSALCQAKGEGRNSVKKAA